MAQEVQEERPDLAHIAAGQRISQAVQLRVAAEVAPDGFRSGDGGGPGEHLVGQRGAQPEP